MKWQIKLLKNAAFGVLPLRFQEKIRNIKRKFIPYQSQIDELRLDQGIIQVEMLKSAGCDPYGKDLLELGTGWQPIIPFIFYLAGCRKIILVDIQRLLDKKLLFDISTSLLKYRVKLSSGLGISEEDVEDKLTNYDDTSIESLLRSFNFIYNAPSNILSNEIQNQSLDIITSRAVLEHIPPYILEDIFLKCHDLLRSNGKMCHIIDNSDHWEHNDKSISRLNFLRYSEKMFSFISCMNPLDYQNRLRHFQYRDMMEKSGFKIVLDKSLPDNKAISNLKNLKIDNSFKYIDHEELAILTSYIVASK